MDVSAMQTWRASLVEARSRGIRSVTDQNGEAIIYASVAELSAAIVALDREISAASGAPPHTIRFTTSKGL